MAETGFKSKMHNMRKGLFALGGMFLLLLAFVVIWCAGTTFRAMGDWRLYAINLALAALLTLPALLLRRTWVQMTVMALAAALLTANLMYCRTYLTAIPLDSYGLASNLADFTASVRDAVRWYDLAFAAVIVLTGVAMRRAGQTWGARRLWIAVVAGTALPATPALTTDGGFFRQYDRMSESCYYSTCTTPVYTVLGTLAYQAMSAPEAVTPAIDAEIDAWLEQKQAVNPWRQTVPDSLSRQNLVIIVLESFESWLLQARTPAGAQITPGLNRLLADSTTFYAPNMLTQVAAGRSIDCQLLLTCGLLPMQNSVWSMKRPGAAYPSLPKAMRQVRGARSAILTCDKPITWNQEAVARTMGYDTLLHRADWRIDQVIGNPPKLSDGSFLRQARQKLDEDALGLGGRPYMLTLVTYSGHNPFVLPQNLRQPEFEKGLGGYPARLADYVRMAHYTDAAVGRFVKYLQSRPDSDRTLVVITGDHEALGTDRRDFVRAGQSGALVSPQQFTPFIVLNAPRPGRTDAVMGQVDMYPAILDMMGLGAYDWKGMGQNILDPARVPVAVAPAGNAFAGDTAGVSAARIDNMRRARAVSDKIIRFRL